MNGRVYDPVICRFLSPDLLVQNPGSTQSFNRYSYCFNNPLAYSDPSGYRSGGSDYNQVMDSQVNENNSRLQNEHWNSLNAVYEAASGNGVSTIYGVWVEGKLNIFTQADVNRYMETGCLNEAMRATNLFFEIDMTLSSEKKLGKIIEILTKNYKDFPKLGNPIWIAGHVKDAIKQEEDKGNIPKGAFNYEKTNGITVNDGYELVDGTTGAHSWQGTSTIYMTESAINTVYMSYNIKSGKFTNTLALGDFYHEAHHAEQFFSGEFYTIKESYQGNPKKNDFIFYQMEYNCSKWNYERDNTLTKEYDLMNKYNSLLNP